MCDWGSNAWRTKRFGVMLSLSLYLWPTTGKETVFKKTKQNKMPSVSEKKITQTRLEMTSMPGTHIMPPVLSCETFYMTILSENLSLMKNHYSTLTWAGTLTFYGKKFPLWWLWSCCVGENVIITWSCEIISRRRRRNDLLLYSW